MKDFKSSATLLPHEGFEVKPSMESRIKVVRQDRIRADENEALIETKTSALEVIDFSAFGIAVKVPKSLAISKDFEGTFVLQNTEISSLNLRIARIEPLGDDSNKLALEVVGEPLNIDSILAVRLGNKVVQQQREDVKKYSVVPIEFKQVTFEIKDFLESLKTKVESLEGELFANGNRSAEEYRDSIAQVLGRYLGETLPSGYGTAIKSLDNSPEEVRKTCIEFFRQKVHELIYSAPIADRIYNKPLGYAGDFEMMNHIYRTKTNGKNLFEKCVHNFFVTDRAAQAVRNRAEYLVSKICALMDQSKGGQKLKILSFACGPAREIQMLLERKLIHPNTQIEFHLLDQDEGALKHAQHEIRSLCKQEHSNLKFVYDHTAIRNVIGKGLKSSDFDLIYSAGLFDYLSDPVAQITAERLLASLKPSGTLLVGNFDVANPSRPIMELVLDWQLIYRSESDLGDLFGHIGSGYTVEKENLGINLFCAIKK